MRGTLSSWFCKSCYACYWGVKCHPEVIRRSKDRGVKGPDSLTASKVRGVRGHSSMDRGHKGHKASEFRESGFTTSNVPGVKGDESVQRNPRLYFNPPFI